MRKIKKIVGREILDSRGNPTVEVDVILDNGILGRAEVPSGASTGEHEALELRDGNKKRFNGKGVLKAVGNVNNAIAKKIRGLEADFRKIDKVLIELDGTKNKSHLGANAILGVSLATAKAAAISYQMPLYRYLGGEKARLLPVPLMNVLNGGMHADNNLDIQEFMIVPFGFRTFRRALQAASEVFHTLKSILKSKKLSTSVGDEGGFAPCLKNNEEALKLMVRAITKAGYSPTKEVCLAIDPASNSFSVNGSYMLEGRKVSSSYMVDFYKRLVRKYPIFSVEDGLSEDDWGGWQEMTRRIDKIQLIGDDIFVTNIERIKKGVEKNVANSVLIKLNQIGTLTETLAAIAFAFKNNYTAVISHRSGDRKSTRLNSSHTDISRMPSSA